MPGFASSPISVGNAVGLLGSGLACRHVYLLMKLEIRKDGPVLLGKPGPKMPTLFIQSVAGLFERDHPIVKGLEYVRFISEGSRHTAEAELEKPEPDVETGYQLKRNDA